MTTYYPDSSYSVTRYVSSQKTALTPDSLQLFSSFTQGGTIPFYVRYQYSWKYVETAKNVYGGWGPLDETMDKIKGTPGLKIILNLAYAPSWWLALDASGNNVGYGASTAILPDGPAMATFAAKVAQRYGDLIDIYQVGNEEYDTGLNGKIVGVGGTILAPTFNYAAQAIAPYITNAKIITGAIRALSHPNGSGTFQWMKNFYTYVPGTHEPPQALPYAHDFHFYDDNNVVTNANYPAPDPTTTDNSASPVNAAKPSIQGVASIMQGVINTYNPSAQVWNLENGYSLPNNSPNNHNSAPTDLPSMQSRYTRSAMAQLHYANVGAKYAVYSMLDQGNDPRALSGQGLSDFNTYVIGDPQWTAGTAPTAYLYQSVDALSFQGTTTVKPADQYFSIMNPTGGNKAWSIASSQTWLVAKTIATNGKNGTNGINLTSGTLAPGQCITLKCSADSTSVGTLTTQTGTLTVTIGSNVSTITVSLFATPGAANPNLTSGSAGPGNGPNFTMTANGSAPASQTITFKNADTYATWWYAFNTANWFSINNTSGTLAAGATQNITISMTGSVVSTLPPGTYTEVLTISATPVPAQYTTNAIPASTQFITVIVHLTVQPAHTPALAVQVSASALQFTAAASGAVPAGQTFYVLNCTNAAENWTATKTQSWLTLSPASGTGLPASGTTTGTSPNIQHTDYKVITATINSTALASGTYTDTITVTLGGSATQTIPVTYIVSGSGSTMIIGASPTSATLSQVQGATAVTATTTLTNSGNTTGNYSTSVVYHQAQNTWLGISPTSASLTGSGGTQVVTFTCTPGTLAPGTYTATITFKLGTSTATYNMTFTVTASGSAAALSVSPTNLVFDDTISSGGTPTQAITLSNTGGTSGTWSANIVYDAKASNWIGLSITTDTLAAGANEQITVAMNDSALAVNTYTATITFSAGSSTAMTHVTLVINPQISDPSAQMSSQDMTAQYQYILSNIVGPELRTLALTYYSGSTTSQVTYGELDALFPFETMSQLHVMKTANAVTAFLNAYAYVANVLTDDPVAYYRLGELSGVSAYDISGRNMTATISNILGVLSGVTLGQVGALPASTDTAMLFDGTSGYITLPAAINTANWAALTVETWINPSNTTYTYNAFVVANDSPNTSNIGFQLAVKNNAVIFRVGNGSTSYQINQAYIFSANTWYHLVGVFSGTAITAYVNGSQIATLSIASMRIAQTTNPVYVACKPGLTTGNNFPGTIDEISLYPAALSGARIAAHYLARNSNTSGTTYDATVLADTPQGYWKMTETSGTTALDATSNHYDAALTGTITYSVAGFILADTALGFDAYGGLTMPSSMNIGSWSAFSLEYWIKLSGGYQQIVITVDSSGNTLYYLNGASYSSGTGDSVVVDQDVYYTGAFSAGSLSRISAYNYVLSGSQIANHYQIGELGI